MGFDSQKRLVDALNSAAGIPKPKGMDYVRDYEQTIATIPGLQAALDSYQQQVNQTNPLWVAAQKQEEDRAKQGQLIGMLQLAAQGKGPSAAIDTLNAGRDANINQAMSMANSARGSTGAQALAARSAMQQGAMATQQTAQQAAIIRANEMNQAYTQLGTALQSQRGGDQAFGSESADIAKANAGFQVQTTGQNDAAGQNWADLYFKAMPPAR